MPQHGAVTAQEVKAESFQSGVASPVATTAGPTTPEEKIRRSDTSVTDKSADRWSQLSWGSTLRGSSRASLASDAVDPLQGVTVDGVARCLETQLEAGSSPDAEVVEEPVSRPEVVFKTQPSVVTRAASFQESNVGLPAVVRARGCLMHPACVHK